VDWNRGAVGWNGKIRETGRMEKEDQKGARGVDQRAVRVKGRARVGRVGG